MGMFDQEIPEYVSGPQRIRRAGQGLADQLAPGIKRMTGYESPKRKAMAIAAKADLSSMESINNTYKQLQQLNPTAASAWLKDVKPLVDQNISTQKASVAKAPAVFQQKINQIKALNVPPAEKAALIKKVLSGAQTQISIDQTTEGAYGKAIGKEQATRDAGLIEGAKSAKRSIEKTNEVLSLLGQGDPQLGFGAEFLTDVNRALGKMGISPAAAKSASDTQLLNALLGSDVFPMIKSLGIGARGLDTPAEREFLREVMTGTVSLEGETLEKMTKLRQKYMGTAIDEYNDRLEKGELDRYQEASKISLSPIEAPKMYTPRPPNSLKLIDKATGNPVYKYPDGNIYTKDGKLFKRGAN